jgi:ribosomal protein S18 acetylase RimI-like enzyme
VALDKEKVAGYINGPVVSKMYITDDLFETIQPNPTEGGFLSILGVVVAKEYRGQGLAGQLLQRFENLAKKHNRNGVTLTCRASLISFYEGYGYTNYGISDSTHGGVEWYNLIKVL